MSSNIDTITIPSNIILFTSNKHTFTRPSVYSNKIHKKENQYISFLQEGDIIETYKKKNFLLSTSLLDIQKYIHNTLQVPYKYILDIEIYYTHSEKDDTIEYVRYPNENRDSIDFMSRIQDTCIECKLSEDIKITQMYICIIISKENRNISDIINRFLFLESYEYDRHIQNSNQYYQTRMIQTRNSLFDVISPSMSSYNNIYNSVQPFSNTTNYSSLQGYGNNTEQKYNSIEETSYFNRLSNIMLSFSNYNQYRPGFSTNNVFQNLVYLMSYVDEDTNVDDFMEPVKVTVKENELQDFLETYICKDKPSNVVIEKDDTCTICLCEYEEDEEISIIKTCKHLFHTNCIKKWLVECNHKCPVCRNSANPDK